MATITDPIPEGQLVPVAFDDRSVLGLPLPHPSNSAKRDAVRVRAAFLLIDSILRGNAGIIEAAVSEAINGLIGAAPDLLNTLDEIANALGDDPNFAATMTAALSGKADKTVVNLLAPLDSPIFTGNPQVPTAAPGDNDAQIASTAFVVAEILARVVKAAGSDVRGLSDDAKFLTAKAMADAMALVTAAAAATIAPDFALGFNRLYTMGLNATLGQPTNMKDGEPVVLYFQQDSTGGRTLSFSATYHKFPGGNVPTLSTAANAVDRLAGICRNRAGTMVVEWGSLEKDIK